jgi:uncharacterized protein (TIRG00374 family)
VSRVAPSAPVTEANAAEHGDGEDDDHPRLEITPRNVAVVAAFVVLAVVALYLLLPRFAGLDDTWRRIEHGSPVWLALAALSTILMFLGYVALFKAVFSTARLAWRESYQITMAALAASRLFSAGGAGGVILQAWALRRAGMRPGEVADRTVTFIVLTYLVYTGAIVLFGYALHWELLPGEHPFALTFVPATVALVVTVFGLSLAFVPPDLQRRMDSWCSGGRGRARRLLTKAARVPAAISAGMREALRRVWGRDPSVLGAIVFWAGQIVTLWASFQAFGDSPPLAVLVLGFYVGMLGNLLPLPGGVGGVDAGMIGTFAAFGVDFGLATVAVLAFRAFTFWLPTVPGVIAYLQLRRTVDRWRHERRQAAAPAV